MTWDGRGRVTTMIGKKMALVVLEEFAVCSHEVGFLPEEKEEDAEEDGQNAHADGLCFLEDLDNAVHERSDPEEPLEESREHEGADDGDVDNLVELGLVVGAKTRVTYVLDWPRIGKVWRGVVDSFDDLAGEDAHDVVEAHVGY